jgi:hypothetical protein
MLAQTQIDTIRAELERDRQIAMQVENLSKKDAVSQIDSENAQLKVISRPGMSFRDTVIAW